MVLFSFSLHAFCPSGFLSNCYKFMEQKNTCLFLNVIFCSCGLNKLVLPDSLLTFFFSVQMLKVFKDKAHITLYASPTSILFTQNKLEIS